VVELRRLGGFHACESTDSPFEALALAEVEPPARFDGVPLFKYKLVEDAEAHLMSCSRRWEGA